MKTYLEKFQTRNSKGQLQMFKQRKDVVYLLKLLIVI